MAKEHILHSLFLIKKKKIADESDEECIIVF